MNQEKAKVIIPARKASFGFWFGGGTMAQDRAGNRHLSGRYRNSGDSRMGIGAGVRGLELAVFKSTDKGETWSKVKSFSEKELKIGDREVLSIAGTALNFTENGVELFVSSEKLNRPFVEGYENFHKPGTGSLTIEVMTGPSVEARIIKP